MANSKAHMKKEYLRELKDKLSASLIQEELISLVPGLTVNTSQEEANILILQELKRLRSGNEHG